MKNKETRILKVVLGLLLIVLILFGVIIYNQRPKIIYQSAYCYGSSYAMQIEEIKIGNDYYLIKEPDGTYYRLSKDMCVLSGYQSE